jgi:hypothetical protein
MSSDDNYISKAECRPILRRTDADIEGCLKLWKIDKKFAIEMYGDIKEWDTSHLDEFKHIIPNWKRTDEDIHGAVQLWKNKKCRVLAKALYGRMEDWDTSAVTDMSWLFNWYHSFQYDISRWDVSNVTTMKGIFCNASRFNSEIGAWDVSAVRDMSWAFCGARSFNQNLSSWCTGAVENMEYMFNYTRMMQGDITMWDVSSCEGLEDDDPYYDDETILVGNDRVELGDIFLQCPIDPKAIWIQRKADPVWVERWRLQRGQNQLEREMRDKKRAARIRLLRKRDCNWKRRRNLMMAVAPFIRNEIPAEARTCGGSIQRVLDIRSLFLNILRYV